MSTRAVIARKTATGFTGRYHHWDGYPGGLGATLFALRKTQFKGDTQAMLKVLLDDHPAGWSTINGADWTKAPGFTRDENTWICEQCGLVAWMHYAQNYPSHGYPEPKRPAGNYAIFGHSPVKPEETHGPECFCHGQRHEEASEITQANASGCGCEWAYVFDGNGNMEVQASVRRNGAKMIGAFGCGDPEAVWQTVATVNLDGEEPNWEVMG